MDEFRVSKITVKNALTLLADEGLIIRVQGKGHSSLQVLLFLASILHSPENANTAIEDRTLGFEQAYTDQGISIDISLWCHIPLNILRSEHALDYISEFLLNHSGISTAFSLTEETARLTSSAIRRLNNHSNIDLLSFNNPHLSGVAYVQQDEQEMARTAVKLLREQMEDNYSSKNAITAIIPVQLIFP